MSSLYVLLNFPIPEHMYYFLAYFYQQLNQDLLYMFGINLPKHSLSSEKVDSKRALYFGISSDFTPNNQVTLAFVGGNIAFIVLLFSLTKYLKKRSFVRRLVTSQLCFMIYGQIINLMAPIVLPWIFILAQAGVRDNWTGLSTLAYSFVFFLTFALPMNYFFCLL
jgi:hypothetical protein